MALRFGRTGRFAMGAGVILALSACASQPDRPSPADRPQAATAEPRRMTQPGPYQPVAFPMPPGSEIDRDHTLVVGSADQWFGTLALSSGASVNDVNAFYSRSLPERGWFALSSLISSDKVVLQFVNRPRGTAAIVMIEPGGMLSHTQVEVIVAPLVSSAEDARHEHGR